MTREERIDWLCRLRCWVVAPPLMTAEQKSKFIEALTETINTLQTEPKWIPVSERLPEDGNNVLFCDIDNNIMIGYHVKGRSSSHFSQDGTYDDIKDVKAWMPLPEPYKFSLW